MRYTLLLLLVWATYARATSGEALLLQGAAQGTTYHIKFVAPPGEIDVKRLQADVEKVLAEIDEQMSTYLPDSEISRFNRAPAGEWFSVSGATAKVVAASREISGKTGGAQDVTVGPLVKLWHFGPPDKAPSKAPSPLTSLPKGEGDQGKGGFKPPSGDEVRTARKRVGHKNLDVRMEPPALRKQIDGLEVDLSSIASGYTIDRLAALLRERGIKDFMVELGGELCAAGKRADGKPWRIAIERPLAQQREMEAAVPLVDAAMATAGGSRHFFEYNGRRYAHIIDPATGRPVEHAMTSVTVASDTCIKADGWDTPLLVLGPQRGMECAEKHGIAAMFISHSKQGDDVRTSSAWKKWIGGETPKTPGGAGG